MTGGVHSVGLGSDFDGIESTPVGLEDVSKYPALVLELFKRGWTPAELRGFTSENFLRVFEGAERVAKALQAMGTEPSYELYDKRTDISRSKEL